MEREQTKLILGDSIDFKIYKKKQFNADLKNNIQTNETLIKCHRHTKYDYFKDSIITSHQRAT